MKVFVEPLITPVSHAMVRVAEALKRHAPTGVTIVRRPEDADVQFVHVIGPDNIKDVKCRHYVIIQYCGHVGNKQEWHDFHSKALFAWSYYDLSDVVPEGMMHLRLPLGVDPAFTTKLPEVEREIGIMTSGYVTGPEAEAIEEVAVAADIVGLSTLHVGPTPIGRTRPLPVNWAQTQNISDEKLCNAYNHSKWVSGLRHVEGFELPVLEGLMQGARPIVFDRPDMREWYDGHAVFVKECHGDELIERLADVLSHEPAPVTASELLRLKARFDWAPITKTVWNTLQTVINQRLTVRFTPQRRRLLVIGDAACDSGFAAVTKNYLADLEPAWDIHVLGINYRGDPHNWPYKVYPAWVPGGDIFGVARLPELLPKIRPEAVVLANDPWNIPEYVEHLPHVPIIGIIAVDGKNCRGACLNGLALSVFWTNFGFNEAVEGGFKGDGCVIPLGVDTDVFKPMNRVAARRNIGLPEEFDDKFIVLNINRNQPRKRLDLTIRYFGTWINDYDIDDACLFLHVAPTGENSYDCRQLARYYGVRNKRLIIAEPDVYDGAAVEHLVSTYNAADVQVSTTQGEGWGLTTLEGMACGIPQIVPAWSALNEWAKDSAVMVGCTSTITTPNLINSVGGIPDEGEFIMRLNEMYAEKNIRRAFSEYGLRLASKPEYRWDDIAKKFREALNGAVEKWNREKASLNVERRYAELSK